MYLEENEAQRFYHIWLGLLEFTNQKHQVATELKKLQGAPSLDLSFKMHEEWNVIVLLKFPGIS